MTARGLINRICELRNDPFNSVLARLLEKPGTVPLDVIAL